MKLLSRTIALVLLAGSAYLFYAEQGKNAAHSNLMASNMREILVAQNELLGKKVDSNLLKVDQDVENILLRMKKKGKSPTDIVDLELTDPLSPKWVAVAGKHVRSIGISDSEEVWRALGSADKAGSSETSKLKVVSIGGKFYVACFGSVNGSSYGAIYDAEALFGAFPTKEKMGLWLLTKDGTVVYGPKAKFVGTKGGNLKPVAASMARSFGKYGQPQFTPEISNYLGFDGHEALGAWAPLAKNDLIAGAEWPVGAFSETSSYSLLTAIGTGLLGIILLIPVARVRAETPPSPMPEFVTENELPTLAKEYLHQARAAAERALKLAEEKKTLLDEQLEQRSTLSRQLKQANWKLDLMHSFYEAISQETGKQVWQSILALAVEKTPGVTALFYRYSPTSFSLVPERIETKEALQANENSFYLDSRIFLGSVQVASYLGESQSFQKWNVARVRQTRLKNADFHFVPLDVDGKLFGMLLFLFDSNLNQENEITTMLLFFESLLKKSVSFCELKSQLLQSKDAYKKNMARPAENTYRSEIRPS